MKISKKVVRRSLLFLVLTLLLMLTALVVEHYPKLKIISGYAAKNMISLNSIGGRSQTEVNIKGNNVPLISLATTELYEESGEAVSKVFGMSKRRAIYRPGLGGVLLNDDHPYVEIEERPRRTQRNDSLDFPFGNGKVIDTIFPEVDYRLLKEAIKYAYAKPKTQRTTSTLVVYKDHIIAEEYGEGYDKNTLFLGWSMTKSLIATLFGIQQYQRKLNVDQNALVTDWQSDNRKNITLNDLLRMQSGLEWDENYAEISDVNTMLYLDHDMTQAQRKKASVAKPGEIWNYSSGTTNLLSGLLREQFDTYQAYIDFPYEALIDKIGMHSMVIEADVAGNFVGSSYGWATARDWSKFGLLYLHKGVWNGERIFDENWVAYVSDPTADSGGVYGAHFWLNAGGRYPDAPKDLFSADGHQGQFVFIIPSKELVVVRTGLALWPDFDQNIFLKGILESIR